MADVKKIRVDIDGNARGLKDATSQANKSLNTLGGSAQKLGGIIGGAFAVGAIANFTKEAFKAAAVAEGVTRAFNKTGLSLNTLKSAVAGTVDEFRLMQAAVKAQNLGIPVEKLAGLFEFAAKRASETGESVDYLVDSIVTGIGRKSSLVLDNLGIVMSTAGKTVAEVADEVERLARGSATMNTALDTSSNNLERLNANFEDLKGSIGDAMADEGNGFINFLNNLVVDTRNLIDGYHGWNREQSNANRLAEQAAKSQEELNKQKQIDAEVTRIMASNNIPAMLEAYKQNIYYNEILSAVKEKQAEIQKIEDERIAALNEKMQTHYNILSSMLPVMNMQTEAVMMYNEALSELDTSFLNIGKSSIDLIDVMDMQDEVADTIDATTEAAIRQRMAFKENAKSAAEAASQTAALAIANRSSAKEIIQAALAVSIGKMIEGAAFLGPIAGPIAAGVAIAAIKALFSNIPEFARGTSFFEGGPALVGERGPEIVNMPRGASVTPNHQLGGGIGGGDIVLKVNEYEFARIINVATANQGNNVARTTF